MQRKADGVQLVYQEGPLGKSGGVGAMKASGSHGGGLGATEEKTVGAMEDVRSDVEGGGRRRRAEPGWHESPGVVTWA